MEICGVYNLQYNARMVLERRMRWNVGWKGDPHWLLVGKPEGKSHLGRPMRSLYYVQMNFNLLAPELLFFFLILAHLYIKCE